jgi:hypothetical protein
MNILTDHRRHKMDEGTKQSMKTILLVAVLFFSFVSYGRTELAATEKATGPAQTEEIQQPSPSELGLVSWWPGDGNTDDIANANYGMLEGGATFSAGQVGQAFLLDGIDDSVDLGNASNLHVSAGDFTVNAWVFFNALSHPPGENLGAPQGDMSIVDKMSADGGNEDGWRLIKQDDNRFWFCLGGGDLGNRCHDPSYTVFSTTLAVTGVWFHIAAVKSASSFAIYVNGALEDERSPVPSFTDTNSANLRIGSYPLEGAHLNGLVDEVKIYDRALSGDEIPAMFEAGCAGMCMKHEGAVEGTIGTQITIAGSDFGSKKGKVTVGGKSCKVLQWANESITCEIKTALPPGTYDVVVQPLEQKDSESILYEKAFTMMSPVVTSVEFGSEAREIDVSGTYFGTKKGKVYLVKPGSGRRMYCSVAKVHIWEDDDGIAMYGPKCKVKEWTMNPATGESTLTFQIPRWLRAGTYGVEVVNKVGRTTALFTVE